MTEPIREFETKLHAKPELLSDSSAPLLNEYLRSGTAYSKPVDSVKSQNLLELQNQIEASSGHSGLFKLARDPAFTQPFKMGAVSLAMYTVGDAAWTKRVAAVPMAALGVIQTAQDFASMQKSQNYRKYSACLAADSALTLSSMAVLAGKIPYKIKLPVLMGSFISRAFLDLLD
ncbi:MAG: hypothetical protein K2X27_06490 [Candidatus Obscuribacterales bacterium]|nr:hypothetical protein [Candidatus Obscuribacterales bacterium]